ncbi:hypothetical protein F0310_04285 (plasmid) [Borrelia sp. A-FGy1]|uniref:hypothetical protein n=1 Tax=Borrelia sp. A-FGy1 TaxID=2608247 RepID=UPI0015F4F274|nr:hypothetical protein [Borrelia sp. A-FGy1]QMU99636.1 hypothetical protein F0310_04285 [Borrelia sp. A-FGy1]
MNSVSFDITSLFPIISLSEDFSACLLVSSSSEVAFGIGGCSFFLAIIPVDSLSASNIESGVHGLFGS